jgi:hypothetical protein
MSKTANARLKLIHLFICILLPNTTASNQSHSPGAGEDQQSADSAGRVTILVYPGGRENRVIEAKNK